MARLPSFNYNAINAPGGIAAGLGGLTQALIQAPQEKRRLALAEQDRIERRSMGEQDLLLRRQAMEDRAQSAEAAEKRDIRDFDYRKTQDAAQLGIQQQNANTLGAARVGGAVNDFQKGGGLMGVLMGAPKTGGRTPGPNDDVIPSHILQSIEGQVDQEMKDVQGRIGLTGQIDPGVRAHARQKALQNAGYNPVTMRRLGPGGTSVTGEAATPQQRPTPSDQPSAAPNQQAPGQSDADILQLKAQNPQYATMPDDEFIRRVRMKGKAGPQVNAQPTQSLRDATMASFQGK